jgi:hypothetical protein
VVGRTRQAIRYRLNAHSEHRLCRIQFGCTFSWLRLSKERRRLRFAAGRPCALDRRLHFLADLPGRGRVFQRDCRGRGGRPARGIVVQVDPAGRTGRLRLRCPDINKVFSGAPLCSSLRSTATWWRRPALVGLRVINIAYFASPVTSNKAIF